jgi:cupin fold WbuC family metalloprotein
VEAVRKENPNLMKFTEKSGEVFVANEPVVKVTAADIEFLKQRVAATARKRVRLCAHPDSGHFLHEMMIVLGLGTYIRPHKHNAKVESFHIVEGMVDVVLFDETGTIQEVVQLGTFASGKNFFYRLSQPLYHTLILRSELLVLHETTNGPFRRDDTVFAPWSPEETDAAGIIKFAENLSKSVSGLV